MPAEPTRTVKGGIESGGNANIVLMTPPPAPLPTPLCPQLLLQEPPDAPAAVTDMTSIDEGGVKFWLDWKENTVTAPLSVTFLLYECPKIKMMRKIQGKVYVHYTRPIGQTYVYSAVTSDCVNTDPSAS